MRRDKIMINKKVIIVVPAYNEEKNIENTINGLKNIKIIDDIVVVNDGSQDNTRKILETLDVNVINLNKNHGKGYAMKKAIEEIHCDIIGFVDGDVGSTSIEIEKLIKPVIMDEVDFTIAMFPKASDNVNIKGGFGFVKNLAKKGVYFYTGKLMDTSLSGQRVYKKNVVDSMKYIPTHYGIEIAMTIQAIRNGYSFREVPVNMTHRYTDRSIRGFKHRGKQFLDILKTLIVLLFRR